MADLPKGFELNRFEVEVDDYFICNICKLVVRHPFECSECEGLLCKACGESISKCPTNCNTFQMRETSKYAMSVYNKMVLSCKNLHDGCNFKGTVPAVVEHEVNCGYVMMICDNPICKKKFLMKDGHTGFMSVCSDGCLGVFEFGKQLEAGNSDEILKIFHKIIFDYHNTKQAEEAKIHMKTYKSPTEMTAEIQKLNNEISNMEIEVFRRKKNYHVGKWNKNICSWSCCGFTEKFALGCKEL